MDTAGITLPAPEANGTGAGARVADQLRDAILDGEITPGERIRQEEVADRLGTSRIPVREALRILQAEGLIEHVPHKGARVARLSMREVDIAYQMRERLEPLALTESIPHLGAAEIDRLHRVQSRIETDTDLADFIPLDREFHLLTYTGCAVGQLTSMITRLWNVTQHYRRVFVALTGPERLWVINAEHRLLLDAIERRDTVDADRYLSGHIRRTRVELDRHPEIFRAAPAGGTR
jgi:DNA-binding GntR family transcriptional regulator